MTENTQTVRDIYQAFGEGRIPDILAQLDENITFVQPGGADIPWSGVYASRSGVGDFFDKLGAAVNVERFQPEQYVESGDAVVALGRWAGAAKATGKPFASTWSMA